MHIDKHIKQQLLKHLGGGEAFVPLQKIIAAVSFEKAGVRPYGLPYSVYDLFYHIAYAQKDIIDFCTAAVYTAPDWPRDYWPEATAPSSEKEWEQLKTSYFKERENFKDFIKNDQNNLLDLAAHGESQSLLREILLIIEHTAYHTGQLVVLQRLLNEFETEQ